MDYGQHGQNNNNQSFFVVESNKSVNAFGPAKNLYSSGESQNKDDRSTGNKIINLNEYKKNQTSPLSEVKGDTEDDNPTKLGEVINLELPPNTKMPRDTEPSRPDIIKASFDRTLFKTTNSGLNPAAIRETEKIADEALDKNNDAEGYYDSIRGEGGVTNIHLNNSYGENAVWQEDAA